MHDIGESGKVTLKQKINTPILNPKQVSGLIMAICYSIIADLMPMLAGEDVNMPYILINFAVSVAIYLLLSFMRAAGVKEVPNITMLSNIKAMFQKIIQSLITKGDSVEEQIEMIKKIGDVIAEWDVLNDEYIVEFTDFVKESINDVIKTLNGK